MTESTSKYQGPRRIGQWIYLRPEAIEEYKKCHAAVWPEVLEQIKDSNVRDCQFHLTFPFETLKQQSPFHSTSVSTSSAIRLSTPNQT